MSTQIEPRTDFVELADRYAGEWVALDPDTREIIAHGPSGVEVFRSAKRAGVEEPLVMQIVDDYGRQS